MRRRTSSQWLVVIALGVTPVAAALAQEGLVAEAVEDVFMDRLMGTWSSTGTLADMPSTASLVFEWVHGHQFVHWYYELEMTTPDDTVIPLAGEGFYKPLGEGRYQGMQLDSGGSFMALTGIVEGDVLTEIWHDAPAGGANRDTFTIRPDGSVEGIFFGPGPDGGDIEMGRMIYTLTTQPAGQ